MIKGMRKQAAWAYLLGVLLLSGLAELASGQTKQLPRPGEVFTVGERTAFVIEPPASARREGPMPWVWYAPTLEGLPAEEEAWMFDRFLAKGVAIAGIDVGESYGNPKGRAGYQSLYEFLTTKRGYGTKPVLLARSRGGLMLYNWAVEHPRCVGGIAGIYPVCSLASYPGVSRAAPAFEMTAEELEAKLAEHDPINRLAPLAKAKVPILHIHGDQDDTVPLSANSAELGKRYAALGGPVEIVVIEGRGHDMWSGWFQSQKLTDFANAQALARQGTPPGETATGSTGPVKVFILAGQSNMQGQGVVDRNDPRDYNGGKGNLEYVMAHSPLAAMYTHLKDAAGEWTVRDDVWIRYRTEDRGLLAGNLTVGFTGYGGRTHIGPELQIGHVLGERLENQVLLIKTAWGGKSLFRDFRPPGSGGRVGPYYTRMLQEVGEALRGLKAEFPAYDDRGYEIAGFVWFQGWNDMIDETGVVEYEENLVHLIKDLRQEWKVPALPVVIGELGNGGREVGDQMLAIRRAQAAAAARPEFGGTVKFVSTTAFARPAEESPNTGHGHHWFGNAESYFLIGNALGEAMAELSSREGRTPR